MLMVMLMLISMISSSVCLIENMLRFNVKFNDDDDFVCFVVNMLMLISMLISLMMTGIVCLVVNIITVNVNFNDVYVCLVVNMLMVNVKFNDDDI